jgi:hypothetical protein
MAAPTDAARQATNISTAATSHAINVGSPSAGTLLIVFVRFAGAAGTVTFTGYTPLVTQNNSDASDDETSIYYRWADGSEGASDTLSTANSVKLAAICWEITGAENPSFSAPTVSTVATGTTAANSANPSSVAPADAPQDTLYLALAGGDGEVGAYTASPTNYSTITAANSGTGGAASSNCFIGGASRQLTASSSEDPGAFTHGAHTTGWTAYTVAIRDVSPNARVTVSWVELEIPAVPTATNITPASISHTRAIGTPTVGLAPAGLSHTRAIGTAAVIQHARVTVSWVELEIPEAPPVTNLTPGGLAHTRAQGSPQANTAVKPSGLVRTRALGTSTVLLLQFMRPDADITATGWTPEPTSPTTLYDKVNDLSVSSYITSTAA